jgi:HrpA-like RNA helicase
VVWCGVVWQGPAGSPSLTPHGRQVACLPLDPSFAHMLLQAPTYHCTAEALTAVAMLSADNVLYYPSQVHEPGSPRGSSGGTDVLMPACWLAWLQAESERREAATAAHKALAAFEGDVPTQVNIYDRSVADPWGTG